MKGNVTVAKTYNKDTACKFYLDIREQDQGHLLTLDISSSTQYVTSVHFELLIPNSACV